MGEWWEGCKDEREQEGEEREGRRDVGKVKGRMYGGRRRKKCEEGKVVVLEGVDGLGVQNLSALTCESYNGTLQSSSQTLQKNNGCFDQQVWLPKLQHIPLWWLQPLMGCVWYPLRNYLCVFQDTIRFLVIVPISQGKLHIWSPLDCNAVWYIKMSRKNNIYIYIYKTLHIAPYTHSSSPGNI